MWSGSSAVASHLCDRLTAALTAGRTLTSPTTSSPTAVVDGHPHSVTPAVRPHAEVAAGHRQTVENRGQIHLSQVHPQNVVLGVVRVQFVGEFGFGHLREGVVVLGEGVIFGELRVAAPVSMFPVTAARLAAAVAIYTDPRPFVVDPSVKPLFAHPADNGFPSDHTALAATVALVVMRYRWWLGAALMAAGIVLGAARVAAHVHHAPDIAVGC